MLAKLKYLVDARVPSNMFCTMLEIVRVSFTFTHRLYCLHKQSTVSFEKTMGSTSQKGTSAEAYLSSLS